MSAQGMGFLFILVTDSRDRERTPTKQDIEEFMRYMEAREFWLNINFDLIVK